jgi:hypothetical protein
MLITLVHNLKCTVHKQKRVTCELLPAFTMSILLALLSDLTKGGKCITGGRVHVHK